MAGTLLILGAALCLTVFVGPSSVRAAQAQGVSGGELYSQHCSSCHQPTGLGLPGAFPPLAGNPAAADGAYVESVIRDGLSGPLEVLGVSYGTEMPAVVALGDDAEIQMVVDFVVELAGQGTTDSTQPQAEPAAEDDSVVGPVVGDVDRGHDLFIGAVGFEDGGAACVACHTAGSVGNLGGQSLGPDLTGSYQTLGGEVGLSGWLANPPSQTMQPIFVDHPLSEEELADVVAFLGDAPNQDRPSDGLDRMTLAAAVGLLALIAGMAVAWRGMRQTYVEKLRSTR